MERIKWQIVNSLDALKKSIWDKVLRVVPTNDGRYVIYYKDKFENVFKMEENNA